MEQHVCHWLAQEDRAAIQRAAESAYKALGPVMDSSFYAMVVDLKKAGAKVRLLDHGELDAWLKTTQYQQVQAKWVNEQDAEGVKGAGPAMGTTHILLNEAMP